MDKIVEVGGFGPVETPCSRGRWFWYRERHLWTDWQPDVRDGEFERACTRDGCGWIEFGATQETYDKHIAAIARRLDAGDNMLSIINDQVEEVGRDDQAQPEG